MLERNPHITLAHVNPDSFPPLNPESGKQCSMWFIGLAFAKCEKSEKSEKSENINVDLTYDIKSFVNLSRRWTKFDMSLSPIHPSWILARNCLLRSFRTRTTAP